MRRPLRNRVYPVAGHSSEAMIRFSSDSARATVRQATIFWSQYTHWTLYVRDRIVRTGPHLVTTEVPRRNAQYPREP